MSSLFRNPRRVVERLSDAVIIGLPFVVAGLHLSLRQSIAAAVAAFAVLVIARILARRADGRFS